jgi:hypothetical protein
MIIPTSGSLPARMRRRLSWICVCAALDAYSPRQHFADVGEPIPLNWQSAYGSFFRQNDAIFVQNKDPSGGGADVPPHTESIGFF